MRKNITKNNLGIGLIEVIVAGGLLAGLGLAVMQINKQSVKTQKTGEMSNAKLEIQQRLQRLQSSSAICALNFMGKTFSDSTTTGTQYFSAPNGNYRVLDSNENPISFMDVGSVQNTGLSASGLIYKGFELRNSSGVFTGTIPTAEASGEIDIIFYFDKKDSNLSYGSNDAQVRIKTNVRARNGASAGQYEIVSCDAAGESNVSLSLMCGIMGGNLVDVAPTGEGPEDMCTGIAGFGTTDTAANQNITFGGNALGSNTTGAHNIVIGNNAGSALTNGNNNIIIGYDSSGSLVGPFTTPYGASKDNNLVIGANDFENILIGATPRGTNSGKRVMIGASNYEQISIGSTPLPNEYWKLKIGDDHLRVSDMAWGSSDPLTLYTKHYMIVEKSLRVKDYLTVDKNLVVIQQAYKTGGGTFQNYSDKRLKNIQGPYKRGLKEIMQLKPVNYKYNEKAPGKQKEQFTGIIAQDVLPIIPEAISKNSDGYYMFNLDPVIWAMVNAQQEQQREIESLKMLNQKLLKRLERLEEKLK